MSQQTLPKRAPLAQIFLSPDEARLRAGWRIVGQVAFFLAGSFVFAIPFSCLLLLPEAWLTALAAGGPSNPLLLAGAPAQLLAGLVSVYLARRFLDRRSFSSLGLAWSRHAVIDLLVGFVLPAFMLGSVFLVQWSLGWLKVQALAWERFSLVTIAGQTLFLLLIFIGVGIQEELIFRGYWLQNLAAGLNLGWGVFLSSAAFAAFHLSNPGFSLPAFIGLLASGIFFAYLYLRTRTLWLPIGIHIGWNLFEGLVYGYQVSGLETFRLIEHTVQGPARWTGGSFGPEAGLLLLPALGLGMLFTFIYTRDRQKRSA